MPTEKVLQFCFKNLFIGEIPVTNSVLQNKPKLVIMVTDKIEPASYFQVERSLVFEIGEIKKNAFLRRFWKEKC